MPAPPELLIPCTYTYIYSVINPRLVLISRRKPSATLGLSSPSFSGACYISVIKSRRAKFPLWLRERAPPGLQYVAKILDTDQLVLGQKSFFKSAGKKELAFGFGELNVKYSFSKYLSDTSVIPVYF